jgi:hypothetical protein
MPGGIFGRSRTSEAYSVSRRNAEAVARPRGVTTTRELKPTPGEVTKKYGQKTVFFVFIPS